MSTPRTQIIAEPKPRRWTRKEYYKMGEMGFFDGDRVELIEGQVFEMSPIYEPHAVGVSLADDILREVFGKGWAIRIQNPLSLGEASDPEPDAAVIKGHNRDFIVKHPTTADLVIEVADSSLLHDRNHKASLYAKAGIMDYWIVNLPERRLEVHRNPVANAEAEFGFDYADKLILKEGESVAPLTKSDVMIDVVDLLPPRYEKSAP